jgi:hypothetical protein
MQAPPKASVVHPPVQVALAQRLLHRRQGAGGGARFGGYLTPDQGYKSVFERASYVPCRLRC